MNEFFEKWYFRWMAYSFVILFIVLAAAPGSRFSAFVLFLGFFVFLDICVELLNLWLEHLDKKNGGGCDDV